MNVRPSVLCPIDYSPASAAALRSAAALAERFVTRLIVLTVREVRPAEVDGESACLRDAGEPALIDFVRTTLGQGSSAEALCEFELAAGVPAVEIARVARERSCDLIVMAQPRSAVASRDASATAAEARLSGATIPVLLTPACTAGQTDVDDVQLRSA